MKALVTGGGGFLGGAIVRQLVARGDTVRSLSRGSYPALEALGVEHVQADLSKAPDLSAALDGVDVVFHVAAKAGVWGDRAAYVAANVTATQHLLASAQAAGVSRFVYTSSPSVTFDGGDHENATEADCAYPERFLSHYPETKAQAEREVLAANSAGFATTALRPHLIWGPGDPHLVPRVIARRREGKLRRVGSGENKVAITHVENAAVSHLQAADALSPGSANAGKAYFITDGEPVVLWDWINCVLVGAGEQPVDKSVSQGMAEKLGATLEWTWKTFRKAGEPPMTRFVAKQLATSHWYDLTAAREDFGYTPVVDPDKALEAMLAEMKR